ncbi:hypothetical protein CY0110_17222 [Crocosphaera chwakensis CCY0110]|uniref:Uncharacterized protein n=1 Tax=Crocosphaera chwakensis CCY0110 TaxID=391612 RepID=A3IIC6_9CHRO|nr:hypothetical protein CY0110_17222 [Crocosphaera chwakensis CCY0110]
MTVLKLNYFLFVILQKDLVIPKLVA